MMPEIPFLFGAACLVAVICLTLKFHRDNRKQP